MLHTCRSSMRGMQDTMGLPILILERLQAAATAGYRLYDAGDVGKGLAVTSVILGERGKLREKQEKIKYEGLRGRNAKDFFNEGTAAYDLLTSGHMMLKSTSGQEFWVLQVQVGFLCLAP